MSTTTASPELAHSLAALRRELDQVGGGARNPVGAARALQRIAAGNALELQGQRDAFRWQAEKLPPALLPGPGP